VMFFCIIYLHCDCLKAIELRSVTKNIRYQTGV
jgi:hypothetical protein